MSGIEDTLYGLGLKSDSKDYSGHINVQGEDFDSFGQQADLCELPDMLRRFSEFLDAVPSEDILWRSYPEIKMESRFEYTDKVFVARARWQKTRSKT